MQRLKKVFSSKSGAVGVLLASAGVLYLEGAVHEYLKWRFFYAVFALAVLFLPFPGGSACSAWGRRALLLVAALFIVLLAVDVSLRPIRLKNVVYPATHYMYRGDLTPREAAPVKRVEKDAYGDLGSLMPEKYRRHRTIETETDRYGYRNPPGAAERVSDAVVLGDSVSYGAGAAQDRIWPVVLEKKYGVGTYNLSQPGASPWEEYITFGAESGRLKMQKGTVVIWAFYSGNDLDEYYGYIPDFTRLTRKEKTRFAFEAFRNRSPLSVLFIRTMNMKGASRRNIRAGELPNGEKMLFALYYDKARKRTRDQVEAHRNYRKLAKTIFSMKNLAANRGVTVKALLVPTKEEVYSWALEKDEPWTSPEKPSGFSAALKKLFAQNGIPFLDVKKEMIRESRTVYESSGATLFWLDDTHLSDEGHEILAGIASRGLLGVRDGARSVRGGGGERE